MIPGTFTPIKWENETLYMLDQRKLPADEIIVEGKNSVDIHNAIRDMVVRGAPLIGFTGLWGMVLSLNDSISLDNFIKDAEMIKAARPTAVNLEYEVNRAVSLAKTFNGLNGSLEGFKEALINHTNAQMSILHDCNLEMAKIAEEELISKTGKKDSYRIMTICNTGSLACGPMGTALGVITYLNNSGKIEHVYATETRPYLQGARLTSYELTKEGISHEITVEGAFSYLLENKDIDAIFVGADRIVANGDTANKVGTSTLSIVAKHYRVPFYVVAPISSFDLEMSNGDEIPIEMREEKEITHYKDLQIAPSGARALNPSFDITRGSNITGIICERGIIKKFDGNSIRKLLEDK